MGVGAKGREQRFISPSRVSVVPPTTSSEATLLLTEEMRAEVDSGSLTRIDSAHGQPRLLL